MLQLNQIYDIIMLYLMMLFMKVTVNYMPKSENQKQKLLYLLKFFYEETDEEHTLTVNQIIDKLEKNGISAARRSIYDDIRTLQDFGIDIVIKKVRPANTS